MGLSDSSINVVMQSYNTLRELQGRIMLRIRYIDVSGYIRIRAINDILSGFKGY